MQTKGNVFAIVIILLAVAASMLVFKNYSSKRKKRQHAVADARKMFPVKDYDSLYAENDTVSFYKDGSYLGMVVSVYAENDTMFVYKQDSFMGMTVTITK